MTTVDAVAVGSGLTGAAAHPGGGVRSRADGARAAVWHDRGLASTPDATPTDGYLSRHSGSGRVEGACGRVDVEEDARARPGRHPT